MNTFVENNISDQADMLARKMPDGFAYSSKYINDSTLRKWLLALGAEYLRMEEYLNYISTEFNLTTTSDLIEEFEFDYGMNSNCFTQFTLTGTIEERINAIITVIASRGTSTESDFEFIANLLGFTVTVTANHPITPNQINDRWKIFVDIAGAITENVFPYTFPIPFGNSTQSILECWFDKLKPAHSILVYV